MGIVLKVLIAILLLANCSSQQKQRPPMKQLRQIYDEARRREGKVVIPVQVEPAVLKKSS